MKEIDEDEMDLDEDQTDAQQAVVEDEVLALQVDPCLCLNATSTGLTVPIDSGLEPISSVLYWFPTDRQTLTDSNVCTLASGFCLRTIQREATSTWSGALDTNLGF